MSATDWAQVVTVVFAAVAAFSGLASIWQARSLHREDAAARVLDRHERRMAFEAETAERRRESAADLRLRQLDQIGRIADLVAIVRHTAQREANDLDQGRIGNITPAPFFWNARKQLELGLVMLEGIGGPELPACRELAGGSAMQFLSQVVGAATSAFDELPRAAQSLAARSGNESAISGHDRLDGS